MDCQLNQKQEIQACMNNVPQNEASMILRGANGNGIIDIQKTSSEGLVDTYTIYYTNGNTDTFTVTNGKDGAGDVQSVNGQIGNVVLTASDVGALPDSTVIPDAQIQSDWSQSDNTKVDYIKNKPTIPVDSDLVHKTGAETISGTKTFTGNPVFKGTAYNQCITVERQGTLGSFVAFKNSNGAIGALGTHANQIPMYANYNNTDTRALVRAGEYTTSNPDAHVGDTSTPVYIDANGIAQPCSLNGNSRNVGEIVTSTIPLTDAGLHLLDGSLLQYGSYKDFIDYMADLYGDGTNIPDYFCKDTYINVARATNAISSGSYTGQDLSNAFDGNLSTFWGCSQIGSNQINGVAYIGQSNLTKPIKKVRLYQSYTGSTLPASNICDVIKLQYSNDGTTWIDIQTVTNLTYQTWEEIDVQDYTPIGSTHSFRLLAMNFPYSTSSYNWIIGELEFYVVQTAEEVWQTSVTNYGSCDKYVYDSTNNTIRLPKRTTEHGALIKSYKSGTDWDRIYQDGWCEQGGYISAGSVNVSVTFLKPFVDINYTAMATAITSSNTNATDGSIGVKTTTTCGFVNNSYSYPMNWQACGYIDISDYQYSPIYEYLVVANSTKTEIEVDIDEVMTDLNGKADITLSNLTNGLSNTICTTSPTTTSTASSSTPAVVVENYQAAVTGTRFVRVWSDGFCEQSGYTAGGASAIPVTLLKDYADTNFVIFTQGVAASGYWDGASTAIPTGKGSFVINCQDSKRPYYWRTEGYIDLS